MRHLRRPARGVVVSAALSLTAALCGGALLGLDRDAPSIGESPLQSQPASAQGDEQQARLTCGGCHAFAPPEILPRQVWRDEFVRMMFIRDNRLPPIGPPDKVYRGIQLPPDMEQVLPFYTRRAPERLPAPEPWPDAG
jgi:hypothetical protein